MNVLVLQPTVRACDYSFFSSGGGEALLRGRMEDYRDPDRAREGFIAALERIGAACSQSRSGGRPEVIAIRALFGGATFRGPVAVTPQVLEQIEDLIPCAPLHLPVLLGLIRSCGEVMPNVEIVLVFETAFFADLPAREHLYALDFDLMAAAGVRRYGFHGIYHEAACRHAARQRREAGATSAERVMSLCLEPRPEGAAVIGGHPLMVTSGATPLEGLPGQTSSGEIDPSIVITLAEKMGWGPEQINAVLTQQSGIRGLVNAPADLETVILSDQPDVRLAREIIQYRMLQACGAGIAAMGGLDTIVFSGRFAHLGERIGPWLTSRLRLRNAGADSQPHWIRYLEQLDRIIADHAAAVLLAKEAPTPAR
ncbi:MAG: hypothetical protein PHF00_13805 [Elusimicrobia bacterium]|nr:hypothetical protein [Elusimicrobiota bacterium]